MSHGRGAAVRAVGLVVALLLTEACGSGSDGSDGDERSSRTPPAAGGSSSPAVAPAQPGGSGSLTEAAGGTAAPTAAEGRALVEGMECNRCHEGTGAPSPLPQKRCVGCHADIVGGRFEAPSASVARWRPHVAPLRFAPSLAGIGGMVKASWMVAWLQAPTDLRPGLHPRMPRLDLDERRARAIALHLETLRDEGAAAPERLPLGDADRGRRHFDEKGCGRCHAFSGSGKPAPSPVRADEDRDRALAPDLRFARDRLRPEVVAAWILDPASVRRDAAMPKPVVTPTEAADLAAFVLSAPLDPPRAPAKPARLPPLDRPVTYDEVASKVLHRICWHCHSQPDFARGDGGPGNTGGFGFSPRRIDLSSYEAIASGTVDAKGEPVSLFSRAPGREEPWLLAALLARQEEDAGHTSRVRGMPLGLPPLDPADIQLVESWIAQGSPR